MSTSAETPVEETVIVETPVVVLEEKTYEYQPTDADGRPIGGRQVIKYVTKEELAHKLAHQNTLLIRKLREETKKVRLGISETDTIEEGAPRFQTPVEFKRRELTGEERVTLARQILDPETFDQAAAAVFEASTGFNPEKFNGVLTTLQQDNYNIKAQREVDKFLRNNPDYIACKENFESITSWMLRYDLAPVESNFKKAFETLKLAGVLVTSLEILPEQTYTRPEPVVVPEPVPVREFVDGPTGEETPIVPAREEIPVENQGVPPTPVAAIEPETPPTPVVSRVPTGLNRSNSSDAGTPRPVGDDIVYEAIQRDAQGRQVGEAKVFRGLAAVNAMPGDEYKRRLLTEKGFAAKIDKLESEAAKRRGGR